MYFPDLDRLLRSQFSALARHGVLRAATYLTNHTRAPVARRVYHAFRLDRCAQRGVQKSGCASGTPERCLFVVTKTDYQFDAQDLCSSELCISFSASSFISATGLGLPFPEPLKTT